MTTERNHSTASAPKVLPDTKLPPEGYQPELQEIAVQLHLHQEVVGDCCIHKSSNGSIAVCRGFDVSF